MRLWKPSTVNFSNKRIHIIHVSSSNFTQAADNNTCNNFKEVSTFGFWSEAESCL